MASLGTATAIIRPPACMSFEVFRAAADPNRFPEQLAEGLRPWQVKKLYLSVRENEPSSLKINVGEYDSLLGRSYREIAREGLSYQRSQGGGQARVSPGPAYSGVVLVESVLPKTENEKSIFDGLDVTIMGLQKLAGGSVNLDPELSRLNADIESAIKEFDARKPWTVAPRLASGLNLTRLLTVKVKGSQMDAAGQQQLLFLLANKERQFVDAMNRALGLTMDVLVDPDAGNEGGQQFFQPRETFGVAIPGQKFTITATVLNRGHVKIVPESLDLVAAKGWNLSPSGSLSKEPLDDNQRARLKFDVTVGADVAYTRPYWSRSNELRDHMYKMDKPELLNFPFGPPDVLGVFAYECEGARFTLLQPAQTVYVDRPWGEQRRLLTVAPAMSVSVSPRVGVIPIEAAKASYNLRVSVMSNVKGSASGATRLRLPAGWSSTPTEAKFTFTHEGEIQNFNFNVTPPRLEVGKDYALQAIAEYQGEEYAEGYQAIAHRDLEPRALYRAAAIDIRGIDVKVAPGLNVGYIAGVGDEVVPSLEQIGVKVQLLGPQELASGSLDQFDAIIVGIRASAVRDDYKAYNRRLLDYVEKGGNLIVQYQTQEFDAAPYGPYPYKLTARAEEVSEEDAKVTILDASNPVFNWPNRIGPQDFDGWVEERGSKWMTQWDEHYRPLLESHDRDQAPQRGGLLQAQYGKGTFTYAGYAFYRQLPAGVPGAYRLFANLISLRKR